MNFHSHPHYQQGYRTGPSNDSRGIAKFDRIMNKIQGMHKNTDDQYYQAIAQTEHHQFDQYAPQNQFHTVQPQQQNFDYAGKDYEKKMRSENQLKSAETGKSQIQSYNKSRTDKDATIRGNAMVKAEDFDQDIEDDMEYSFPDPFIMYKIVPAQQYKMAIDVTTTDTEDLTKGNIIIWDYHGGPNQHFYLKKARGINEYYIINASTGFVLQVPDSSTANDVSVIMTPRFGTPSEMWKLEPCGKDMFIIRSFCGKVLDVQHHWMRNGVSVVQFQENGGKNQKWRIWPS